MSTTLKDNVIGLTIAERYRVDALFSSGGVSRTYRAFDMQEQTDVLVRVLHSHKRSDANAIKRFEIAAKAAAKMSHPGIVPLLHSGFLPDGLPYLIYEYIRGHNLRDEIASAKMIAPDRARDILLQVTSALDAAHRAGVIHRNLKPGNILIKESEKGELIVYVTGFGIARQVSSSSSIMLSVTQTKKVVGSPTYMSPEQFTTADIDARSDVYSLGIVAYEMLCGQPPYRTNSFLTTAAKHSFGIPDSIRTQNPDVPPYMESIIVGAMRKTTADRYQSMAEMHEDLDKRECRFGEIKFADFAKQGKAAGAKYSKLAIFGMVCAALFVIAACVYCMQKPNSDAMKQKYKGEPAVLFDTSQQLTPAHAEYLALRMLHRNRLATAQETLQTSLEHGIADQDEATHSRIALAYAYAKMGMYAEAGAVLKYVSPIKGEPMLGWTLRKLDEVSATTSAAGSYRHQADELGYDAAITGEAVEAGINHRIGKLQDELLKAELGR